MQSDAERFDEEWRQHAERHLAPTLRMGSSSHAGMYSGDSYGARGGRGGYAALPAPEHAGHGARGSRY